MTNKDALPSKESILVWSYGFTPSAIVSFCTQENETIPQKNETL